MEYDGFIAAAMDVGVFGILARSTERYHVAEFSYTFSRTLRPWRARTSCASTRSSCAS